MESEESESVESASAEITLAESAAAESLAAVERTLGTALAGWAAVSVAVGGVCTAIAMRTDDFEYFAFGRQTAAWGAIDGVIAGMSLLGRLGRGSLSSQEVESKARSLRRFLVANAIADVGYIASGVAIMSRGRRGTRTLGLRSGDGLAIVLQGAFLLVLDASQARRLRVPSR